jgi:hypothetical protein
MANVIAIQDWKPIEKNTLKGTFSAIMPSGMVFHNLMLHEKGSSRWIAFPAREYFDPQGVKQYANFIQFTERDIADRFRDQVLAALDRVLEQERSTSTSDKRSLIR